MIRMILLMMLMLFFYFVGRTVYLILRNPIFRNLNIQIKRQSPKKQSSSRAKYDIEDAHFEEIDSNNNNKKE